MKKVTKTLTRREQEFLHAAAMGLKNHEIAKEFSVSEHTVKKTLENIFFKIQAKDRTNAVAIAILNKLIMVEELLFTTKG